MGNMLGFLEENINGILVLLLLVFAFLLAINWLARIFRWGRFKEDALMSNQYEKLSYIITQFFANIINDFKHLLALIIVLIFSGLIIFSMAAADNFDNKMEALQLVIASLGGLLGSIIGYYFGESAASSNSNLVQGTINNNANNVNDDPQNEEFIPVQGIEETLNPDINQT